MLAEENALRNSEMRGEGNSSPFESRPSHLAIVEAAASCLQTNDEKFLSRQLSEVALRRP